MVRHLLLSKPFINVGLMIFFGLFTIRSNKHLYSLTVLTANFTTICWEKNMSSTFFNNPDEKKNTGLWISIRSREISTIVAQTAYPNILSVWLCWHLILLSVSRGYLFNIWREVSFITKQASTNRAYLGLIKDTVDPVLTGSGNGSSGDTAYHMCCVLLSCEKLGVCMCASMVSTVNIQVDDEA